MTVYRGDAFPSEFRGNLFVGDVANNLIHRALAVPDGVRVVAKSAEEGREFLASRDNWFRPVQMANGPDGCLWIIDMCRELIEGAAFLPPRILKHMDVASGVDRGRIWRIVPEGHELEEAHGEQGNHGRAGCPAGAPKRLAPRHGVAIAVPAARPDRSRPLATPRGPLSDAAGTGARPVRAGWAGST